MRQLKDDKLEIELLSTFISSNEHLYQYAGEVSLNLFSGAKNKYIWTALESLISKSKEITHETLAFELDNKDIDVYDYLDTNPFNIHEIFIKRQKDNNFNAGSGKA